MSQDANALAPADEGAAVVKEPEEPGPDIYRELGTLPPATVITEDGLAAVMGKKCRESIKRAVERGELPRPVKIMGRNAWTVGYVVKYLEDRLDAEARKVTRLRPSA